MKEGASGRTLFTSQFASCYDTYTKRNKGLPLYDPVLYFGYGSESNGQSIMPCKSSVSLVYMVDAHLNGSIWTASRFDLTSKGYSNINIYKEYLGREEKFVVFCIKTEKSGYYNVLW